MAELKPFEIKKFGGWRPGVDPNELGWSGATDLENVDLNLDGRLRQRDLFYEGPDSTYAMHGLYPFPKSATSMYNVSFKRGSALQLYYYDSVATAVTGTWGTSGPYVRSAPFIGTPTSTTMYITSGVSDFSSAEQLKKWTGPSGSLASAGVSTKPLFAAVTPNSNRLALGGFINASDAPGGSNGSLSTVFFSDPGVPETFGANNYVTLDPGDGERITGMTTYRDLLFVFKESKFYVFYGEGIGSDGSSPEFNYRTVQIPDGVVITFAQANQHRCTTGKDGVYFSTGSGIYITDGGKPAEISGDLRTLFRRNSATASHLSYVDGRLYMLFSYIPDGEVASASYILVYDTDGGYFLKWAADRNITDIGPWMVSSYDTIPAVFANGVSAVYIMRPSQSSDDLGFTYCFYTTGQQAFGPPGAEGIVREVLFEGDGDVSVTPVVDGTTVSTVSMTTSLASVGRYRKALRGRGIAISIANASSQWELASVIANVEPSRPVGDS